MVNIHPRYAANLETRIDSPMAKQTDHTTRKIDPATEQLYREVRELRAITEAGFAALGISLDTITKATAKTDTTVTRAAQVAALKTDAITWVALSLVLVGSQAWVTSARNMPGWMRSLLPQPPELSTPGPSPHDTTPINRGDTIAGYRVTSAYGPRKIPCPGCSSFHPAIDLATPAGTPIYAPAPVDVICKAGGGAGNYAQFELQGITHQLLHLQTCKPGKANPGQPIGATGATGVGTGAHLDIRVKQDGQRVLPSKSVIAAILDPAATAPSPSDAELARAIGRAEGTRDRNGNPTTAYQGHRDPGNGKRNQGSFSYQHGAATPEEADQKWLAVLRQAEQEYQAQAKAKYGHPLSRAALVAILDAHTQSPDAARRLLAHLPTHDPTPEQLIAARTAALEESRAAIGGPPMNVPADQARRIEALLEQL